MQHQHCNKYMLIFIFYHLQGQGLVSLKSLIRQPHTTSLQPPLYSINTGDFPERLRGEKSVFHYCNIQCSKCVYCLQISFRHCNYLNGAPASLLGASLSFLTRFLEPRSPRQFSRRPPSFNPLFTVQNAISQTRSQLFFLCPLKAAWWPLYNA